MEGEADLGMPLSDIRTGGGISADLREVLFGGGLGDSPFWVGAVGGDLLYGEEPWRVPQPGGMTDHGENLL